MSTLVLSRRVGRAFSPMWRVSQRPRPRTVNWDALERRYLTPKHLDIALDRLVDAAHEELRRERSGHEPAAAGLPPMVATIT